ncbi:MAG: nucleotide exchange factor GrpE [Terrimicrobiaceae bacterium]|nr:nucleotide exchange factor GrpE [Terrimicrobiaceae bacterium]
MTEPANPPAETEPASTESASAGTAGKPADEAPREDLEKFKDLYLRSKADLDNYKKRTAREREDAIRYANIALLDRLLPVLDNFDLGLDAARQSGDAEGILQGMSMVQKQLHDFLRDSGAEAIDAVGAPFDPNFHEAIGHEPSAEVAEGTVLRQVRRGYKLRDRLLRPATVIVSKGAE